METNEITVKIKDQDGLGLILRNNYGYTQNQIIEAEKTIRRQFRKSAHYVFSDILQTTPPKEIEIQMSQNDREELKGLEVARLASFSVSRSTSDKAVFLIHEKTVREVLDNHDMVEFESTVLHEMIHAGDFPIIKSNHDLLEQINSDNPYEQGDFFFYESDKKRGQKALLGILAMLDHYRAEGIAILGEQLLLKRGNDLSIVSVIFTMNPGLKELFDPVDIAMNYFCKTFHNIFFNTLMKAHTRITRPGFSEVILDDDTRQAAYSVAPYILLLALDKLSAIESGLAQKAIPALVTGDYDELDEQECIAIIRAALSLPLPDYIQGLMYMGDFITPIQPFLAICAKIQQDYNEESINSFYQLINDPNRIENFNQAMTTIMGSCMSEEEIDAYYEDFLGKDLPIELTKSRLKEKVAKLYSILKNANNDEGKQVANWALTYFFDDQDIIHDDIKGIGFIDDMIVIDIALNILNQ